ncbi:unnamed protein product [Amaranthus hypochondriacus]
MSKMTDDKDMIERFSQKQKMLVDAIGDKYEYTIGNSSKTADIAGYEHTTSEFTFSEKESESVMDDSSSITPSKRNYEFISSSGEGEHSTTKAIKKEK